MEILKDILIGYGIGCMIFTTIFLINLYRHLRQALGSTKDAKVAAETVKLVYIEHHEGWSYAYDRITNRFIAHAENDDLVLAKAKSLFPKYNITVIPKTDLTTAK